MAGDAEDAEEIAADPQAVGEVALAARRQIEAARAISQGSRKSLLVIAHLFPDRVGEGDGQWAGAARIGRAHLHKALGILHRQRTQHDRVEDAEYRRVCAYAERQRDNRGGGKAGIGAQHSQSVTAVLNECFEERPDPHGAAGLGQLGHVAEGSGVVCQVPVQAHLVGQILTALPSVKEVLEASPHF